MAERPLVIGEKIPATPSPGSGPDPRSPLAELEMHLLLEGVLRLSGFDFREYSPMVVKRRVAERLRAEDVPSVTRLLERVIYEPDVLERLLYALTSNGTAPFRDTALFAALASTVIPRLRTYPHVRIWVAGNASDAYPLAILLFEAGLLERVRIYATEATESGLAEAKLGMIPPEAMRGAEERYRAAGGVRTFAEYVQSTPRGCAYDRFLARNVLFTRHHLAAEGSFNEFQAVIVRTAFTAYGRALAYRVHETLYDSTARLGFLCLPSSDATIGEAHRRVYEPLPSTESIFRRVR